MMDTIMVFMDYLSVFGMSYHISLNNLNVVLKRCLDTNSVLNWENYHFIVKDGIVV